MGLQEIGIPLDLSVGNYDNTVYKDGLLQLIEIAKDSNNRPIYNSSGSWESSPIPIKDKIKAFKNIARKIQVNGAGTFTILVSTSDDGYTWGNYIAINGDGSIHNPPANFAKVKIEFNPASVETKIYVNDFSTVDPFRNQFIETVNGKLQFKRKYYASGIQNEGWNEAGKVYTTKIEKLKFKKIDSLSRK